MSQNSVSKWGGTVQVAGLGVAEDAVKNYLKTDRYPEAKIEHDFRFSGHARGIRIHLPHSHVMSDFGGQQARNRCSSDRIRPGRQRLPTILAGAQRSARRHGYSEHTTPGYGPAALSAYVGLFLSLGGGEPHPVAFAYIGAQIVESDAQRSF